MEQKKLTTRTKEEHHRLAQLNYEKFGLLLEKNKINYEKHFRNAKIKGRNINKTTNIIYIETIKLAYIINKVIEMTYDSKESSNVIVILGVLFNRNGLTMSDLILSSGKYKDSYILTAVTTAKKKGYVYVFGNRPRKIYITEKGMRYYITHVLFRMIRQGERFDFRIRFGNSDIHNVVIDELKSIIS